MPNDEAKWLERKIRVTVKWMIPVMAGSYGLLKLYQRLSGSSSNPTSKVEDIQSLLNAHTTVESWGTPCITNLAELMGEPVPETREEKAKLIQQAEQFVKNSSNSGKVAEPTGERFARSPSFLIDEEEVSNPCADKAGAAARCAASFLADRGVSKVVAPQIGSNAERFLSDEGIEIERR